MKTPLLLFLAMILNAFPFPARGQGHSLTRLWDRYEQAADDDRPRDQLAVLEEIKSEARGRHLLLDFCDAARLYVDVSCSTDWKLRDSLERRLDRELEALGEPAAVIYAGSTGRDAGALEAYIRANSERLAGSANRILYSSDHRLADGDSERFFRNWPQTTWNTRSGASAPAMA